MYPQKCCKIYIITLFLFILNKNSDVFSLTGMQTSAQDSQNIKALMTQERLGLSLAVCVCVVCICSAVVVCMCEGLRVCVCMSVCDQVRLLNKDQPVHIIVLSIVLPTSGLFIYSVCIFIVCVWGVCASPNPCPSYAHMPLGVG